MSLPSTIIITLNHMSLTFLYCVYFLTGVSLLYNVVLVSAMQQRGSATCIHIGAVNLL